MSATRKQEEDRSNVYQEVEKHSEGMISFAYRPPSQHDIEALKDTETYRGLMQERGKSAAVGGVHEQK